MTNTSIFAAFERMWQHVVAALGDKASTAHRHDDDYATKTDPVLSGSLSLNRKDDTYIGYHSVSLGGDTTASGSYSHAEGYGTTADAYASHAEGNSTTASALCSHVEGNGTNATGLYSHAEGLCTTASGESQHVQGRYNIADSDLLHIVGNGSGDSNRSNAHTIDNNGNAWFLGDVYVGSECGINKDYGSKRLATEEYVDTSNIFKNLYTVENVNNSTLRIMTTSNTRRIPGLYLFVGDSNLTLGSHTFGKYLLAQVLDDYTNSDQTSGSIILRYNRSQSMRDVMTGCLYTQTYAGASASTTNSYTKKSPSYV